MLSLQSLKIDNLILHMFYLSELKVNVPIQFYILYGVKHR